MSNYSEFLCKNCKERLEILKILKDSECTAREISLRLGKKNYSHLSNVVLPKLKSIGLIGVKSYVKGRKWYLTDKGKKFLEILDDPVLIELYLAGNGQALEVLNRLGIKIPFLLSAGIYWRGNKFEKIRRNEFKFASKLFIDSGAQQFYKKFKGNKYPYSVREYLYFAKSLNPDYIATLDLPLDILVDDGRISINEGLVRTVEYGVEVFSEAEKLQIQHKIVPVIQGYNHVSQWLECLDLYIEHGIDSEMWGVGSLCMMKSTNLAKRILEELREKLKNAKIHVFGLALNIFRKTFRLIDSFDTSMWVYWAKMDGCAFIWDPYKERFIHLQARDGKRYDTLSLMAVNVYSIIYMVDHYNKKKLKMYYR